MNLVTKFAYYQKELEQIRDGEPVTLRRVQIDPVAYCNHDCPFCIYRYNRDEDMNALFDVKDLLSFDKMIEIFDDCVRLGIKAVELTGGGEPTLHPQFPEILESLNERGLEIGLVTNGSWREKFYDRIIAGMKNSVWARFSMDASTEETHRVVHAARKGDFDRAKRAIKGLVEHTSADVGISFIVQKTNYFELDEAVDMAEDLGVRYIRIGGLVFEGEKVTHLELDDSQNKEVSERVDDIMSQDRNLEIYNAFNSRSLVDFERYNKGDDCYYSYISTVIGADAKVYPCCVWKYRPAGVIADLNEIGFAEAWDKNALGKFYDNFDISEKCNRCHLIDKNKALYSFVTAGHINFV